MKRYLRLKHNLYPLVGSAVGVLLFECIDWSSFQEATCFCVATIVGMADLVEVRYAGNYMSVNGAIVEITARCTFADFYLALVPFVLPSRMRSALFIAGAVAALVFVGNVVRLAMACAAYGLDGSWLWVHDVPGYTIWVACSLGCLISVVMRAVPASHRPVRKLDVV